MYVIIITHFMILFTSVASGPFCSILVSWLASHATYLWQGGDVTSYFLNARASSNIWEARSEKKKIKLCKTWNSVTLKFALPRNWPQV
jgi:hypothetical protein